MYAWHDKEYFAVAHGISGILMILLMRPELLESTLALALTSQPHTHTSLVMTERMGECD
jgi:hypothetical protein